MGGGQLADGVFAGGTVDVQYVEQSADGQADVGLGVAGPPGQHPRPVTGGVLDPMRDEGAEGMFAGLAAAWIPTRTARPDCRAWQLSAAGEGLEAGLGQLQRQRDRVVVDADGLQHLARRGHAHDHRAAAVQVDPDVLFTHGPPSSWLV
jgi:hypothetical protein